MEKSVEDLASLSVAAPDATVKGKPEVQQSSPSVVQSSQSVTHPDIFQTVKLLSVSYT